MAIAGLYKCFDHWHKEGTVWIYSDPHFGDKELAAGKPGRPTDEEHIKLINSCVGRKDTIIILGDIVDIEPVKKIRGYKVLIMGNHDSGHTNYERVKTDMFFPQKAYQRDEAFLEIQKNYPNCNYDVSEWYDFEKDEYCWKAVADNMLFDEVYEGPLMIGEKLLLTHEPVEVSWAFNIHGHDHAGAVRANHLNVCSDVIGYKPVNFNKLMKNGLCAKVESIHRATINKATKKKRKEK